MKKRCHKLVRDKIPQIIKKNNATPITHIATKKEYKAALLNKLDEELAEFKENPTPEEIADLLEVLRAVCDLMGWNLKDIEKTRQEKQKKRGGFKKRIILETVVTTT